MPNSEVHLHLDVETLDEVKQVADRIEQALTRLSDKPRRVHRLLGIA